MISTTSMESEAYFSSVDCIARKDCNKLKRDDAVKSFVLYYKILGVDPRFCEGGHRG